MGVLSWRDSIRGVLSGTLHAPGATVGDVLTVQADRSVSPAPGGGSLPGTVRLLDLGLVSVADVLDGAVTLYEPGADEIVGPVILRDWEKIDPDGWLIVTYGDQLVLPPYTVMAAIDSGTAGKDSVGLAIDHDGLPNLSNPGELSWMLTTAKGEPIVAGLSEFCYGYGAAAGWTPNTPVDTTGAGSVLLAAAGHLWSVVGSGTTGAVEPDFAGNIGGTVADNDLTWSDQGAAPSTGQFHVYAYVSTPVAP